MTVEPSNSAGCGGIGPAGKIHKFGTSVNGTTTSSNLSPPVISVLRPPRERKPNSFSMPGRRRSASISNTRSPRCAKTSAEFALIVVFPSCGKALVTRITLGGAPNEERRIEVRSDRYASAASDLGRACVTRIGDSDLSVSTDTVVSRLRKEPLLANCSGIVQSAGRVEIELTSSMVLMLVSDLIQTCPSRPTPLSAVYARSHYSQTVAGSFRAPAGSKSS